MPAKKLLIETGSGESFTRISWYSLFHQPIFFPPGWLSAAPKETWS
jgi:hypothetical protein